MIKNLTLLAAALVVSTSAFAQDLEKSLAITNPATLKILESNGFSLADLLTKDANAGVQDNQQLASSKVFAPVLDNLKGEMQRYKASHPKAGVGLQYDERLFDLNYLSNPRARFVLVGVINRMDLGYKPDNLCGEIRFVYRLAYNVIDHGAPVSSRLPITINLAFHAATDGTACSEVAKAWLRESPQSTPSELTAEGGALSPVIFRRGAIKTLEMNLQIVRLAASAAPDFGGHAEYLLKVFEWSGDHFAEGVLENEIDLLKLQANPSLATELKRWLLDPKNLKAIDAGNHLIPDKFLVKSALSMAPGGIHRSGNRPYDFFISKKELADVSYEELENIKSPAGFLQRLNDSSCIGCHQTRAIAGFHFTGQDPLGKYPGNSVFLPGSAHFMGDLPRRLAITQSIAQDRASVDYSRGFSARPQARRSKNLVGTGLLDNWGAFCSSGDDPSFRAWSCSGGLTCKTLLDNRDGLKLGVCLSRAQEVGDPCEEGIVKTTGFGLDTYTRTSEHLKLTIPNAKCSPQSQEPGTRTGGFLNGNIRTGSCENLPKEATCGPLPAARPGFNACIGRKNFGDCLKEYSLGVGLRGCDQTSPCRDDYICSESYDKDRGSCVPPYFLFQFRVDGHPKGD